MFRNFSEVSNAFELITSFRKAPVTAPATGSWLDLSMIAGFPIPNYYASTPLESKVMSYSRQKGLYHGHGAYNYKCIKETMLLSSGTTQWTGCTIYVLDYLMYYPFVDEGIDSEQFMDNVESLTRYTDGKGVMVMAVSLGARLGGQTFQFKYTNQDGVSGRVSPLIMTNNISTVNGTLINTTGTLSVQGATPFLPLQDGDTGVRSIQSVQMISGVDTGIFALVLVKPLTMMCIREGTVTSLKDHVIESGLVPPRVYDDAYLNFLSYSTGAFTGQWIYGTISYSIK